MDLHQQPPDHETRATSNGIPSGSAGMQPEPLPGTEEAAFRLEPELVQVLFFTCRNCGERLERCANAEAVDEPRRSRRMKGRYFCTARCRSAHWRAVKRQSTPNENATA